MHESKRIVIKLSTHETLKTHDHNEIFIYYSSLTDVAWKILSVLQDYMKFLVYIQVFPNIFKSWGKIIDLILFFLFLIESQLIK